MNDDCLRRMMDIADTLRKVADDLTAMSQEGYNGDNPDREGAVGDVVEGREVEDITRTSTDIGKAIKLITIGL